MVAGEGRTGVTGAGEGEKKEMVWGEGEGLLVWESNRSGEWRIWTCALDGSGVRMLSPDEAGHTHAGPHISPDGNRVAYLSVAGPFDHNGVYALRLMGADGSGDRELVGNVRFADGGNRAVVWISEDALIYVDEDGGAVRLEIGSGERKQLTDGGRHLIDRTLRYAFERFYFHRYDAAKGEVVDGGIKYGGCEPYFSHDGRWGIRMSGAGGPIGRVDLATGEHVTLLERNDARMPAERNYMYFPMVSRCGRLLAFAASPDKHDHATSDYDIFVAPVDPETLMLTGDPVRYAAHPKTDRYPDVFMAELPLGRHAGEAPLTVKFFEGDGVGGGRWEYGGGEEVRPGVARFADAGEYAVEREFGGVRERGTVRVTEKRAPKPVGVLVRDGRHFEVMFDEPVEIAGAAAEMGSGTGVKWIGLDTTGRGVEIELEGDLVSGGDEVVLSGVRDRAQEANEMEAARLKVERPAWPSDPAGLAFVWEKAGGMRTADGGVGDVKAHGRARLDRHGSMVLTGGYFSADAESAKRVLERCQGSHALSVEAVMVPDNVVQGGPARVVTFSNGSGNRNFTLGQVEDRLVLRLRTPETGSNAARAEEDLCELAAGKMHHVVVTYGGGKISCYLNGKRVAESGSISGEFSNWEAAKLLFGDENFGGRQWSGILDGIAIYDRVLGAVEVARNARAAALRWEKNGSDGVETAEVEAELLEMSAMPTVEEIAPYREGLVVGEYEVKGVRGGGIDGVEPGKKIRVVRWAILDKEMEAVARERPGTKVVMRLQPEEVQVQIESSVVKDTLPAAPELPYLFDATP